MEQWKVSWKPMVPKHALWVDLFHWFGEINFKTFFGKKRKFTARW
jgi:hypothetical protein